MRREEGGGEEGGGEEGGGEEGGGEEGGRGRREEEEGGAQR